MKLFPQLLSIDARALAEELHQLPLEQLVERSMLTHHGVIHDATGGQRASISDLETIRTDLRVVASKHGLIYEDASSVEFPSKGDSRHAALDLDLARTLHGYEDLTPHQAIRGGVWAFFACVLAPEIVRWRYPGKGATTLDRFLKNRQRNVFARTWWRAHLFYDESAEDPYWLVEELGEDEMVQILDRTRAAGYPPLARALGRGLAGMWHDDLGVSRSDLLREALKRILRWMALIRFELLDTDALDEVVRELYETTLDALGIDDHLFSTSHLSESSTLLDGWRELNWQDVSVPQRLRWTVGLSDVALVRLSDLRDPDIADWGERGIRWQLLFQMRAGLGEILERGGIPKTPWTAFDDLDEAGAWLAAEARENTDDVDSKRVMTVVQQLAPEVRARLIEEAVGADDRENLEALGADSWTDLEWIRRCWGADWRALLESVGEQECRRFLIRVNYPPRTRTPVDAMDDWLRGAM